MFLKQWDRKESEDFRLLQVSRKFAMTKVAGWRRKEKWARE
jgi:hypothetical protein